MLIKDLENQDYCAPVEVDLSTLHRLGWTGAFACRTATDADLATMITPNSCGSLHTWGHLELDPRRPIIEQLKQFEQRKRPTELFFYYGVPSGSKSAVLFGVATVSSKMSNAFPHEGFPVIARCLINEQFRRCRLYAPVLLHRFHYCRANWGDNLLGVHVGSGNPAVYHTVNQLGFIYLGNETLGSTDNGVTIFDYLWMSEKLKSEWESVVAPMPTRESGLWVAFQAQVQNMLANRFDQSDYRRLKFLIDELQARFGWSPRANATIAKTMDLMAAIPVTETEVPGLTMDQIAPATRRAG